jgi:protein TonB
MFESTLEAQGLNDGERRLGSMSVAVMAHLGIVAGIVAVTAIIVPPVFPPEPRTSFVPIVETLHLDDVSPHPADPPPKKEPQTPKAGNPAAPNPIELSPAPVETPSTLPNPEPEPPDSDFDGRGDGPTGLPGGGEHGDSGDSGNGHGDGESGGGLPGEPLFVTGDMVRPVLLVKVEPVYPEVARRAGMGGRVTVSAVIGLDGGVETAEVLASTNPLFDQAALDAVRKWRYRAATMNGRPVRVYFTVVVDFVVR